MADSIAEFARKVMEALGGSKAPTKRDPRKAEVIGPTTARALEVAVTKPEYGYQDMGDGTKRMLRADPPSGTYPGKHVQGQEDSYPVAPKQEVSSPMSGGYSANQETVEQRTQKHLKKSGMQMQNQASPAPSGQEWDENGNPIHPYVRGPVTAENAWDQLTSAPADYLVAHGAELSPEHKELVSSAIAKTQARAEKVGGAQLQKTMSQVRAQPGGEYGAQKGLEFASAGQGAIAKAVDAVQPKTRDISSISREFSNDEDKQKYLEDKRKAGK